MNGEVDRRGGIIWHTQGSGKSLTMVFLIRAMRSRSGAAEVQDRPGHRPHRPPAPTPLTPLLWWVRPSRSPGAPPRFVSLLRPARSGCGDGDDPEVPLDNVRDGQRGKGLSAGSESFETLNESESILVMVDEAHRSHGSVLACQPDEGSA